MANLHNDESIRLRIMLFFALVAFTFLGGSIWRIQVLKASEYRSSETRQSIRRVRRPAPRGRIFDRNGVLLAGNRPSYSIAVFVEELRQPGRISNTVARIATYLDEIGTTIGKPREVTHDGPLCKKPPLYFLLYKIPIVFPFVQTPPLYFPL